MKFLHISDLHIGKRLREQPLIEEQRQMLAEIACIVRKESVDAVLIAGDVYDRSIPPLEAVTEFDDFLTELNEAEVEVFIIAGNHDSAERLDFGARILSRRKLHIAGGELKKVTLEDNYGNINIWLMPYMRTADAEQALESADVNTAERNIILSHQFIISEGADPEPGGSEIPVVGGVDALAASLYERFDYVALGHIHRSQKIVRETMRYSGSPYCYSFDECGQEKSAPIIALREKTDIEISFAGLTPERGLYRIECTLKDLPARSEPRDSYIELTLTDEEIIVDVMAKVREVYPNTLKLIIKNRYAGTGVTHTLKSDDISIKSPFELFSIFFQEMNNGVELSDAQRAIVTSAIGGDVENETK